MDLGTRIRRAREAQGLTQQALADLVGVSVTSIKNWETGKHISRNRLGKLEQVLRTQLTTPGGGSVRDEVTLRNATDAQLLGELTARLADLDAQVRDLTEKLAEVGITDPQSMPGSWAARSRPADSERDDG